MERTAWVLVVAGALATQALAQQSASFRQEEHVLSAGSHPEGGVVLSSSTFRVTLDSLGEDVVGTAASASFRAEAGFLPAFLPPGEVVDLVFTSKTTLAWDPEPSRGTYNVYRGDVASLPGGYGACLVSGLPAESATDPDLPPPGGCFFYLVTVRNRLGEEGTKGYATGGAERPNPAPCP